MATDKLLTSSMGISKCVGIGEGLSMDNGLQISPDLLNRLDQACEKIVKLEFISNELIKRLERYEADPLDFLKKKIDSWELK